MTLLCLALSLAGCGEGDDDNTNDTAADAAPSTASDAMPTAGFSATGSFDESIADDSVFVVLWSVTSGSPDSTYIYGNATADGAGTFMVSLPNDPPAQAINSYGVAVGIVATLPTGTVIEEGELSESMDDLFTGVTARQSIIWRAEEIAIEGWQESFPTGYSCGTCVDIENAFDEFEVSACDLLEIEPLDSADFCEWT